MFVDINGHAIFALDFSSGPRTFVAHSGWIGNFEDWIATLAPLSKSWRTVIYDHRGAGETRVPVEAITPQALVDDLFTVMDTLGIDDCVLGGFSRGTVTAMRAVLQRPERFKGLVLLNGAAGISAPGSDPVRRMPPSQWPGETFEDRLRWFAARCTPEDDVEHIRRWAFDILDRAEPDAADRLFMMEFGDHIDWATRLPQLAVPTLLIHGERDVFVQSTAMQYAASLLPTSKLVVLEGSGHLPAMVRPHDVARAINEFFTPTDARSCDTAPPATRF